MADGTNNGRMHCHSASLVPESDGIEPELMEWDKEIEKTDALQEQRCSEMHVVLRSKIECNK